MFTVALNVSLSSSKVSMRSCIATVNNVRAYRRGLTSQTLKVGKAKHAYPTRVFGECFINSEVNLARGCSSDVAPSKANVFGDLGDRQFTKYEMDEDEKREEEFVENEARVDRRHRLSPGGYANLIKSRIQKGDLTGALGVLDLVSKNRDKPTAYMYNLLLRSYAVIGDFKRSRSLYVKMKKLGLKRNAATYTSIINACANYHHSPTALEYLGDLRRQFADENVPLNETHYNAFIKAYGRHGAILEAFMFVDHMRDLRLPTDIVTFNSLLFSAISNEDAGLRHALVVWHAMRRHFITPNVLTYNLLLRAMRDAKLGDLKVDDALIDSPPEVRILLDDGRRPDLLRHPPTVSTLIYTAISGQDEKCQEQASGYPSSMETDLPVKLEGNDEKSLVDVRQILAKTRLETFRSKNRLILFGGLSGILENMERDGVTPDTKSITLLMELTPPSDKCERAVLDAARAKRIPLDIDFFNMLMKKKSLRRDYTGAKAILDDIQRNGLCPDIITWGILALSCHNLEDAKNLLLGMHATGHRLNTVIAGTLINNACRKQRFMYILEIMDRMLKYNLQPNWELYKTLDTFEKDVNEMIESKKFGRTVSTKGFKTGFAKFSAQYPEWQKKMGRNTIKANENDWKKKGPRR